MPERSRLVKMRITNIGCIGPEGLDIELDDILCLVGANNTGKSTVLRAYELAAGTETFRPEKDLCTRAADTPASVELWVHIPAGIGNVSEDWKVTDGELRLVRSRWEWSEANKWSSVRRTWDPHTGGYAEDAKASGLDSVFSSRLPKPFRIGTLENPEMEHEKLLTLLLQPAAERLKAMMTSADSDLAKALKAVTTVAEGPVSEERQKLDSVRDELNRSHNVIFPDLKIDFKIGLGEMPFDPIALLRKNSLLQFKEWSSEVKWHQQGTGSQRALFWTMLQVRSKLNALSDIAVLNKKKIAECTKGIEKCEKDLTTLKKEEARQARREQIDQFQKELAKLNSTSPEASLEEQSKELALPGYMLLIDEPEVALHPGAVRAASRYLYGLAEDPSWQVMMTTHSPAFIDPLHDHTTIVRLERCESSLTPKTYRVSSSGFEGTEKEQLKMLNRFDQGLAEMFFGQYPVLVEGDTEFAAFEAVMNLIPEDFPPTKRPLIVRARGKAPLRLVARMLVHFKVPFSILHDADSPRRRDGKANSAWTENHSLYEEIRKARGSGIRVVHRVSVPNFDLTHLLDHAGLSLEELDATDEEKPWRICNAIAEHEGVSKSVMAILGELLDAKTQEEPFDKPFGDELEKKVVAWADKHANGDPRFKVIAR